MAYMAYDAEAYWNVFMEKTEIPREAQSFFEEVLRAIHAAVGDAFQVQVVECMREPQTRLEGALRYATTLAEELGYSPYTFHFIFIVKASYYLRKQYDVRGIPELIFWDTIKDVKYKLMECWDCHKVWGTFVAWWYKKFLSCDIFMLGRLQYERVVYPRRETYSCQGVKVEWGDPVLSIHIPSCGPLTPDLRMESYRRAFAFFSLDKRPMVCMCESWLLYPGHREFLPPHSNILSFMDDFDIIDAATDEKPTGSWRVFGADVQKEPALWPENTGLQRAYKHRILSGGGTGGGFGLLIFDGEHILRP